jgi:3D (Asp-Asp-Asp) domain-containing protein
MTAIRLMRPVSRRIRRSCVSAVCVALTASVAPVAASAGTASTPSGGAALGGPAPTSTTHPKVPPPPSKNSHGKWLSGVEITEYWPAPERWFRGALVKTPGLPTRHRIDWLYSAEGLSMEGEGVGLDGRMYHIDALGRGGWVTLSGAGTAASDGWAAGAPYWRAGGYWRNRSGGVTFPLATGGWSAGKGRTYIPLRGVSFAAGGSSALHYYQSIAVDPATIPLGSRVYIPAYKHDGYGGWFVAQDTGGALNARHVDVYRSPPASPNSGGQYMTGQRIYVIRPRKR